MKLLLSSLILTVISTYTAFASAEVVSSVKAAELACHRVDRLVVLKKIDKSYLSKFQKLNLVELAANHPSGGKFSVTTYQSAPATGNALSLTILLDETGKVLNHQVNDGGTAGPDIAWTGKDPVTLAETGLHYVLDESATNEQLRPFAADFQALSLTQKTVNGAPAANLVLTSRTTTAKLVLTLDLNGKLLSKEVKP